MITSPVRHMPVTYLYAIHMIDYLGNITQFSLI
jgi:hypothetical protein